MSNDDNDDGSGIGQPVRLLSDRLPWESPQSLGPGSPHNLPPPVMRPGLRTFQQQALSAPGALPVGPFGPAVPVDDKYRYGWFNGETIVAVGVASVQALAEPAVRRNSLMLRNSGATNLFVAFGNNATTNSVLVLVANAMILFDTVVPQDDVYCISDAAGGQLTVAVSNYTPGM